MITVSPSDVLLANDTLPLVGIVDLFGTLILAETSTNNFEILKRYNCLNEILSSMKCKYNISFLYHKENTYKTNALKVYYISITFCTFLLKKYVRLRCILNLPFI